MLNENLNYELFIMIESLFKCYEWRKEILSNFKI